MFTGLMNFTEFVSLGIGWLVLRRPAALRHAERISRDSLFWRAARFIALNAAAAESDWGRAASLAEEWQALAANDPEVVRRLATIGLNAKRYDLAREMYEFLAYDTPDSRPAQLGLGQCDYYEGRFEEARARFRKILQQDPHDGPALTGYALSAYALGDHEDAEPFLRRVVEYEETDDLARFALGMTCLRLGDEPAAMGHLIALRGLNSPRADDLQRAIDGGGAG